jgi:hypothetical protein
MQVRMRQGNEGNLPVEEPAQREYVHPLKHSSQSFFQHSSLDTSSSGENKRRAGTYIIRKAREPDRNVLTKQMLAKQTRLRIKSEHWWLSQERNMSTRWS